MSADRIGTYAEFWPFYLREHTHPWNVRLHLLGDWLGLACWYRAWVLSSWGWFLAAFPLGYAAAWLGHFAIQGNRPATFRYPVWSFVSDVRMFLLALVFRLEAEFVRHGLR